MVRKRPRSYRKSTVLGTNKCELVRCSPKLCVHVPERTTSCRPRTGLCRGRAENRYNTNPTSDALPPSPPSPPPHHNPLGGDELRWAKVIAAQNAVVGGGGRGEGEIDFGLEKRVWAAEGR